ncbi:MAG TPA: DsbC family protein [Burkholderiales bacterium]
MIRTFLLLVLFAAGAAQANEAAIRKALTPKLGGAKIEGVQPAPMAGLWEVRVRGRSGVQLLYTDAAGTFLIDGNLYDLKNDRNLTDERLCVLNAIKFESLPFEQAVKVQRGDGRRVVAMFSDPYCPYCQKFEQTLQKINDITIYVFMYPVIRPQNADHSKAVWCSPDRQKAWLDLALNHKPPPASPSCENPVEKNLELGQSLGVNGTPTLIFANGERVGGGMGATDFVAMLEKAGKETKKR